MRDDVKANDSKAKEYRLKMEKEFLKKGIIISLLSGISYGLYSAFLTLGMSKGVWANLYEVSTLEIFKTTIILSILGAGINDLMSTIWAFIKCFKSGKLGDFILTMKSKPALAIIIAASIGGPVASVAYTIALKLSGSIVIPIAALNTAIGSLISVIVFKKKLSIRTWFGIIICIFSSFIIGFNAFDITNLKILFGIFIALIAACGWGIEGVIAGFETCLIDSDICILIRQLTSTILNIFMLFIILCIFNKDGIYIFKNLLFITITDINSIVFFMLSGFFTVYAFSFWYKGNSMCGISLGMACNGTYAFWGPLFCWIIVELIFKISGYNISYILWLAAILMAIGIFIIVVNPINYFKKKEIK